MHTQCLYTYKHVCGMFLIIIIYYARSVSLSLTCTVSMKKGNDVDIIKSITATVYINRFVLLYIRKLMFIVLTTEASYLPFLNIESRSTVSNLTGVDDGGVFVTLPSQLHFGNYTFTTAYVSVIWYTICHVTVIYM